MGMAKSQRQRPALVLGLLLAMGGVAAAQPAARSVAPRGLPLDFVSGPARGDAGALAVADLQRRGRAAGLSDADLADFRIRDRVSTRHNGATHVYLRQRYEGIEVEGAEHTVTVASDGRVVGPPPRFARELAARVNTRHPSLDAAAAVAGAAAELGLPVGAPPPEIAASGGPARAATLAGDGLSLDPIPVELVYVILADGPIRLAWRAVLRTPDGRHWWDLRIDAETGAILARGDWIDEDGYRVFDAPLESPAEGARTLAVDPAGTGSPFGWHDTNGSAGAEFTDTRGNNVFAQDDTDANNTGGFRPSGGPSLVFDFPLDLAQPPASQLSPAVANLFYWNNLLHDLFYGYGFDEAAGNFQENNYGNGGSGSDAVNADAQDGSGINNANFGTPPDGSNPRMQMYLWEYPALTVTEPAGVAGTIEGGSAEFGAALTTTPVGGDLVQALDAATGSLPSTTDGCSPFDNAGAVNGNIALIDRGECTFVVKVANAQTAGAVAAVIVNNQGNEVITMGGSDGTITIPSLFIGQGNGEKIEAELGLGSTVAASLAIAELDGDFDNGIVIHEYGHGVSNRLTGGPSNVSCLDLAQPRGMGEGWSDYFAMAFTHKAGDTRLDPRPIGSFAVGALGAPRDGYGIRNYPYSTDLAVDPQTYVAVETTNQPHGIGEVWAVALWEMYWNLVDRYGFDPDLTGGSGGNNLATQLVIDGMKIQVCEPSFLDARDAILMADNLDHAGANQCRIWRAFAKRGMGENAVEGNPNLPTPDVTEDFTVPAACVATCGDDVIEADEECDGAAPGSCTAGCSSGCFCNADADADGLPDEVEIALGLDPGLPDSDGDGTLDFDEDSDGDGLGNGDELFTYDTDPGDDDSDGDGFLDGAEVAAGSDPNDPFSVPAGVPVPALPPTALALLAVALGAAAGSRPLIERTDD